MRFFSKLLFSFLLVFIIQNSMSAEASDKKDYYKVTVEDAPIYKKVDNKLVKVGSLYKNQVFIRAKDYGNWHQIQLGNSIGYIKKTNTELSKVTKGITNISSKDIEFQTLRKTVIYDNSSGRLIPFASLEAGTTHQILRDYGHWLEVSISGRVGYLHKSNVVLKFSSAMKYFNTTVNKPVYIKNNGKLKLVGYLKKEQVYKRMKDYGNWHQIQYNGEVGFVNKDGTKPVLINKLKNETSSNGVSGYVVKLNTNVTAYDNSTGKLVPYASLKSGENYQIHSNYGRWYEIVVANRIVYVNKDHVTLLFTSKVNYFKAKSNGALYRKSPNGLVKMANLEKNQQYPIVADYGNWHRVQLNDGYGYVQKNDTEAIMKSNIRNEHQRNTATIGTVYVKADSDLYDNTSGSLVRFAELKKGQSFEVVKDYGSWFQIKLLNRIGYVHKNNVTFSSKIDSILKQQKVKSSQLIIVEAPHESSTKATLKMYEKQGSVWKQVFHTQAVVGKNGMRMNKVEGDGKTPMGLYPLRGAFGTKSKPVGVDYPYTQTTKNDYWVDDVQSSDYNKWIHYKGDPSKRWNSYEDLYIPLYAHAVAIGYNDQPVVKGKGSAIFLHVWRNSSSPTLGCVAIEQSKLVNVLKRLDSKMNPSILIGTSETLPEI